MADMPADVHVKPKASKLESRSEATTEAARTIIGAEVAARIAKTDRLRAARLAQEAAVAAVPAAAAATPSRRRSAAGKA